MTCRKCRGFMVEDVDADYVGGTVQCVAKCVNCANVLPAGPIVSLVPTLDLVEARKSEDEQMERNRQKSVARYHRLHPHAGYYQKTPARAG